MKTILNFPRYVFPTVLLGSVLLGCHRGHDHSHAEEEEHHHEEKTAQITVWTDRHEIFTEHRLVPAGVATKFVTHVTDLKTQEPRSAGPIRFVLRQGNDAPVEKVEPAPTRAGIYEAMLTVPQQGDWNVSVLISTESGEAAVTLPPVKVYASKHDAQHGDAPEAPEGISFLKEQQWKILSKTEPVTKRQLVERLRLPASVAARPGSKAAITAPLAGRLLVAPGKALPTVGDTVQAGQTLALVQPMASELAVKLADAEAEGVRAKLAVEQAEQTYKRTEKLAQAEAKSVRELQEAEFALKTAQARLEASRAVQAAFQQGRASTDDGKTSVPAIELKAPIAGVLVSQTSAAIGEWVTSDKPLFTVLDSATVFVEARIPESAVARLNGAKGASLELPGARGTFIPLTGEGRGKLVFLSPQVDTATRTVSLVYEANNREGRLRVGQQVTLHVETAHAEDATAILDTAIVEEGGQPICFVQLSGETFEKRELTLGFRDGNFVQVLRGVNEGERVVTKGAMAVRLAAASNVIPAHGHAH
jgi:RND family efflux transporter MFP subunit